MASVFFDWDELEQEGHDEGEKTAKTAEVHEQQNLPAEAKANKSGMEHRPSVYAVSDLHTDMKENRFLFAEQPSRPDDAVLLAGDISDNLDTLRETFGHFTAKFGHVFYCPGNHDLWLRGHEAFKDSVEKWHAIEALCAELSVHTKPKDIGGGVMIVPMLSWYEPGFDEDPTIEHESLPPVEQAM